MTNYNFSGGPGALPQSVLIQARDSIRRYLLSMERRFLAEAEAAGLHGLEGHRSLGGIQVFLYNAVTQRAVDALCDFLESFRRRHASRRKSA